MRKKIYPLLSFILLLTLWQVMVTVLKTPTYILPGPLAVVKALVSDSVKLWQHSLVTFGESLIGLLIASVIAFFTALIFDRWELMNQAIYPLLVVSQTLPIMVLGPLLTLWFGFGLAPKIILVVLMSYFPIVIAFAESLKSVSQEQMLFLQTMGASSGQIYRTLKIPLGMSGFFAGLKVAATYCVGGAVIGEWLSAQAGLGYYMIRVKNGFEIDKVFAAIVCVIGLSLIFNGLATLMKQLYFYFLYQKGRLS